MINASQNERTAKQLLPKVLEEKSATEFTASSPRALNAQCDQWDKEIKNNSILMPVVLFPISESRGKNAAGTFQLFEEYRLCLPLNHGCCNMSGIHGACAGTSKMEMSPIWPPTPSYGG